MNFVKFPTYLKTHESKGGFVICGLPPTFFLPNYQALHNLVQHALFELLMHYAFSSFF